MSVVEVAPLTRRVQDDREERARTLEAAALEIEMRGWTRGLICNSRGEVCLAGAILSALGDSFKEPRISVGEGGDWGRLETVWGRNYDVANATVWNDTHHGGARDAADVCFLLRWRAEEIRDGR